MIGIALSGKAGSGKNALAESLSSALIDLDQWPVLHAFGDVLKAEVWSALRLRKEDPGGREALIQYGDRRRAKHPFHFVDRLDWAVSQSLRYGLFPIVTDVRFQNEYDWARKAGLYCVRVEASNFHRWVALISRGEDPELIHSDHPTECSLDHLTRSDWDYVAFNDHDLSISGLALEILKAR